MGNWRSNCRTQPAKWMNYDEFHIWVIWRDSILCERWHCMYLGKHKQRKNLLLLVGACMCECMHALAMWQTSNTFVLCIMMMMNKYLPARTLYVRTSQQAAFASSSHTLPGCVRRQQQFFHFQAMVYEYLLFAYRSRCIVVGWRSHRSFAEYFGCCSFTFPFILIWFVWEEFAP